MARIPYLIRRKNVFYFRFRLPVQHQNLFKTREIVQSLRTENREEAAHRELKLAAHVKEFLHDIKAGKTSEIIRFDSLASLSARDNEQVVLKPLQAIIVPSPRWLGITRFHHIIPIFCYLFWPPVDS